MYDFLNSLRTVNVTFVIGREAILTHEVNQEKSSTLIRDLLKEFRNHLRTARALTLNGQGLFAPNWGMKMNDERNLDQTSEDGKSEIPLCICRTDYRFSECLYIRRSIRLSEWTPNSAIDETVKSRIFEATGKLKVILNSIRSKDTKRMIEIDQSETNEPEAGKFQTVYSSFTA